MFVRISFTNVYQCDVVFICGRYQSSFCQNWSHLRQNYALINCFAFEKNSECTILWELNFFQHYSPFASILWECFRSWYAGRLPYWRFMLRLDVKQLIPCFDMVKKPGFLLSIFDWGTNITILLFVPHFVQLSTIERQCAETLDACWDLR